MADKRTKSARRNPTSSPPNVLIGGPVRRSPVVSVFEPPLKACGMTELSRYCASCSISEEAREAFSPAVDIFAVEIFISTDGRNLSVNQPLRELRALLRK